MKSIRKIFIALALTVSTLITFVACNNSTETEAPTELETKVTESTEMGTEKATEKVTEIVLENRSYKIYDIRDQVRCLGRTQMTSNGIVCDWTATGIEFMAYIGGEFSFSVDCTRDTYFTVYVDDERIETRFKVENGVVNVDDIGENKLRKITIRKQTEASQSLAVIKSIDFYGMLVGPSEQKKLYIEFIGDSLTSGYGNLCTNGTSSAGSAIHSNGTLTYATLAAEYLAADINVVSNSGVGIYRGFSNQDGKGYNISDVYPLASYHRNKTEKFDFSNARVPDIVVINLGRNDYCFSNLVPEAEYKAGVLALIESVRGSYDENIPIVWVSDFGGASFGERIEAIFAEEGGEANGLYYIKFTENHDGGDSHPSVDAHYDSAAELVNFIVEKGLN